MRVETCSSRRRGSTVLLVLEMVCCLGGRVCCDVGLCSVELGGNICGIAWIYGCCSDEEPAGMLGVLIVGYGGTMLYMVLLGL